MDRQEVIEGLQKIIKDGGMWKYHYHVAYLLSDAAELLKEQEESIPVSWLKEKLECHPELPYAVTDGIINVLDLWEGRRSE